MRRFLVVLALALLAPSYAAAVPLDHNPPDVCGFVSKKDTSDDKARERCDAPASATVYRQQKNRRWVFQVVFT